MRLIISRFLSLTEYLPYPESVVSVDYRDKTPFCAFKSIPYFKRMENTEACLKTSFRLRIHFYF